MENVIVSPCPLAKIGLGACWFNLLNRFLQQLAQGDATASGRVGIPPLLAAHMHHGQFCQRVLPQFGRAMPRLQGFAELFAAENIHVMRCKMRVL